jgi:hypothetical protein
MDREYPTKASQVCNEALPSGLGSLEGILSDLRSRIAILEAERAVRNLLARYMALCDEPCAEHGFLGDLFTADAIWIGRGKPYEGKFGSNRGRENIVAFLGRYLGKGRHFVHNTHFLTSDSVTVDAGAAAARGQWTILQTSSYVSGGAEMLSARLSVDFVCEDGKWRISRFSTTRLFASPWNPGAESAEGAPDIPHSASR